MTRKPLAIRSLWHARQLLSSGRRRRVVCVAGVESLAHVADLGGLLHHARHRLRPKNRRWDVLGFHRVRNLGTISAILADLRRSDLPRLHGAPLCLERIQRVRDRASRVRALSFRVGGGAPGQRTRVLADRLLLLAVDAEAQVLSLHALRQRVHDAIEAVRAELERPVDMFEHAAA